MLSLVLASRRAGLTGRVALSLLVAPAALASGAGSVPSRLADALAAEIARVARGRSVQVEVPEDRSGRGPGFTLDLLSLTLLRIRDAGLASAETGPRLRVQAVVTESPDRMVVSARVVEEPASRLVDVLSVSVDTDRTWLPLAALPRPPTDGSLDVLSSYRTPPLAEPVLALAPLGDQHLVALSPDHVVLYRLDAAGLVVQSRLALPGPAATVRAPAGILSAAPAERAFWALTNRAPRAALYAFEGDRLALREEAAALPWPGSEAGLRFRPGTNLIEGRLSGVGQGPFLAVGAGGAVAPDGRLLPHGSSDLRVGTALAPLWPGAVAASSALPPGPVDSILILSAGSSGVELVDSVPVDGAIRALARQPRGRADRLIAAVETPEGSFHLAVVDVSRGAP